jgi:glutathione synthase/RimK-type ligase-like ATP-grasp enzyme
VILILTGYEDDKTIRTLSATIERRGAQVVIVDSVTIEGGHITLPLTLHLPGPEAREVRPGDLEAAFLWRLPAPSRMDPRLEPISDDQEAMTFVRGQWSKLTSGLGHALEYAGVPCVNRATATAMWEDKVTQLMVADEVGITTPTTCYTCDLSTAAALADAHGGRVVYKPFAPYLAKPKSATYVTELFSQVLSADELRAQVDDDTVPAPGIFQPYVEKAFELRVVYIGGTIFTCRIESQQSAVANRDWRRYDLENTPHIPHELDPHLCDQVGDLMKRMDLQFGSLDFIVTPEGDHVFLEVNPGGQFDWIAAMTGYPLYERLAELLIEGV